MKVLDVFNVDDCFQIFVKSQSTKIMIESNAWLRMNV